MNGSIYEVRNDIGECVSQGYATRQDAKMTRDDLKAAYPENNYRVSRGEDHPRGPSAK